MSQGPAIIDIQYPSDYDEYLKWKEQQLSCPIVSSDAKEKAEKKEEAEKSKNINSFESFLEKWIDSDWLVFALGCYNTIGGDASNFIGGFFVTLPQGLPNAVVLKLEKAMVDVIKPKSNEFSVIHTILCKYKDNLMDFIIYLFKYYGMVLVKNDKGKYIINDHNKKIAGRLKKIYEIITNYFIGGPDLSDIPIRRVLKMSTRHSKIFNILKSTIGKSGKIKLTRKKQPKTLFQAVVKRLTPPFRKEIGESEKSGESDESDSDEQDEQKKGGKRTRKNHYNCSSV
jgi:hypothetical protein